MRTPEFEREWYERQNVFMIKRYQKIFSGWNSNWNKFYSNVSKKLNDNTFHLWIFLCGLDPVLQQAGTLLEKKSKIDFLTENTKKRIYQILKEQITVNSFLKNI